MRVLLLGDASSPHVVRWLPALRAEGFDVALAGMGDAVVDVPFLSMGPSPASPLTFLRSIPALRRFARRIDPDVVHAHFISSYGVLAAFTSGPRPIVLSAWGDDVLFHDAKPWWHRTLVRRTIDRAAIVTYDSDSLRDGVAAISPGVQTAPVVFGPERAWADAPRSPGRRIFSPRLLGALYWTEGIIDAFSSIAGQNAGWQLDVVTWGAEPGADAALLDRVVVGDRVHRLGRMSRADMQRCFLTSEIFCSVPFSDGTAASLLEGMAAGSFPIVSDIPANRQWIDHEVNGLIVRPGDVGALRAAMQRAIDDDVLRNQAATINRNRIADDATWEGAVASVAAIYRTVSA
jgi:hypothetical protein